MSLNVASTHDESDLASSPGAGALAGVVAAGLMLGVLAGLEGQDAVAVWLTRTARVALSSPAMTSVQLTLAGLSIHLAVGSLLGALHAACQRRTATRGLLVVGAFYGFVLWVTSVLILGRGLHAGPPLLGRWAGLLMCVAYGLVLAGGAILGQWRSARLDSGPRPVD